MKANPNTSLEQDLRKIVSGACTLYERKSEQFTPTETPKELIESRLAIWRNSCAKGFEPLFERRLKLDALDLDQARHLMQDHRLTEDAALPDWAINLGQVILRIKNAKNVIIPSSRNSIRFEEFISEFVDVAVEQLRTKSGNAYTQFSATAHQTLRQALLLNLTSIAGPVFTHEFQIYREVNESGLARLVRQAKPEPSSALYQSFVRELRSDGLLSIFLMYPSLGRNLSQTITLWVDAQADLLCRLQKDLTAISETFFPNVLLGHVIQIKPDLSDRHKNGRTVIAIKFNSGHRLVYKPKDQLMESKWFEFLDNLNSPIPLLSLKTLTKKDYGWVEYADPSTSTTDPAAFFEAAGALLSLLTLLEATDCHYENIIAINNSPILIDAETLFHPVWSKPPPSEGFAAQQLARDKIRHSVLRPGLLPSWSVYENNNPRDHSGLGAAGQEIRKTYLDYEGIATDDLRFEKKEAVQKVGLNLLTLEGVSNNISDYRSEFVSGFEQMMRFVIQNRKRIGKLLEPFARTRSRFVMRPTQLYSDLIMSSRSPTLMRGGLERSFHFDRLCLTQFETVAPVTAWQFLRTEHRALQQLDVPIFYADVAQDALTGCDDRHVAGVLSEPAYDRVKATLDTMDERTIEDQVLIIWGTLHSRELDGRHADSFVSRSKSTASKKLASGKVDYVAHAEAIGERLANNAIRGDDGSVTWISFEPIGDTGRFRFQPISSNLYSGSLGVSLFFYALYQETGDKYWETYAKGAIAHILADLANDRPFKLMLPHGGLSGVGALLYSCVRLFEYTQDEGFLEAINQCKRILTDDMINDDTIYDLVGGSAGTILGCLAAFDLTQDRFFTERAVQLGDHLLNNQVFDEDRQAWGWQSGSPSILSGMSHGVAGIAMALSRLGQLVGKERFSNAAETALQFEDAVYSYAYKNWLDLRETDAQNPQFMNAWCHGATGIGMARAAMMSTVENNMPLKKKLKAEAKIGAVTAAAECALSGTDSVCCGNLGRADALLTIGQSLNDSNFIITAQELANKAITQAKHLKGYAFLNTIIPREFTSPSFFQGLAGIGYQLLRLQNPKMHPSVLIWATRNI